MVHHESASQKRLGRLLLTLLGLAAFLYALQFRRDHDGGSASSRAVGIVANRSGTTTESITPSVRPAVPLPGGMTSSEAQATVAAGDGRSPADVEKFKTRLMKFIAKYANSNPYTPLEEDSDFLALADECCSSVECFAALLDAMRTIGSPGSERRLWLLAWKGIGRGASSTLLQDSEFLRQMAVVVSRDEPLWVRQTAAALLVRSSTDHERGRTHALDAESLSLLAQALSRFGDLASGVDERLLVQSVANTLGAYAAGYPFAKKSLMDIAADSHHPPALRLYAWGGLWRSGDADEETLDRAAKTMRENPDPLVRAAVIQGGLYGESAASPSGTVAIDTPARLAYLREIEKAALHDSDEGVRWLAATRLASFGRPEDAVLLSGLLSTPATLGHEYEKRTVWSMLGSLALSRNARYLEAATSAVRDEPSAVVRLQIVESLGQAVREHGWDVPRSAQQTERMDLGDDRYRLALDALVHAADSDPDPHVREAAQAKLNEAETAAKMRARPESNSR
ncbi:MAG: HEAT repeat domain-containing protein [Planctomycetes bacterium]|nr:HEAT repeat domain-containing protein [Planctomycetota bacterium]